MPVTQKDIARHIGLSRSSVVQALNGIGDLTPATRERILQAARELGYRPNALARALVTGRTHTLGFWYSPRIDPITMRLINGLDTHVLPYKLLLINVSNRGKGHEHPDEFPTADFPVDGIFAFSIGDVPDWFIENGKPSKPLVSLIFDAFPYRPDAATDAILIKIAPACEAALRHLVQTRQNIVMLCVESMPEYGDVRVRLYEAAMKAAGREPRIILTSRNSLHPATKQAVLDYVKANGCPDALFCGNDDQALAAHSALHELGFEVPRDVALVGNDGLEEVEYHVPALSTIKLPIEEIVRLSWEFLEKRISDPDAPRQYAEVEAALVLRESSQPREDTTHKAKPTPRKRA